MTIKALRNNSYTNPIVIASMDKGDFYMKFFYILIFLPISAMADCRFYVEYESYFKENERGIMYEMISTQFKNKFYHMVSNLKDTEAVLKVSMKPVLSNEQFLYETKMKLLKKNGEMDLFEGLGINLSDSINHALSSLATCE